MIRDYEEFPERRERLLPVPYETDQNTYAYIAEICAINMRAQNGRPHLTLDDDYVELLSPYIVASTGKSLDGTQVQLNHYLTPSPHRLHFTVVSMAAIRVWEMGTVQPAPWLIKRASSS